MYQARQMAPTARMGMAQTAPASVYEQAPSYGGPVDYKQSVVLSSAEFNKMTQGKSVKLNVYEHEVARKAKLRQASQNRYKNWGNTLEATREKKKRDRQSELANKEAQQQVVDQEEAELREQQRRAAIDKANRLLFRENDRVKSFQSSMLLSTVMQERQKQINVKQQRRHHESRMDDMWLQIQNENLAQQYKREELEEVERKSKNKKLAAKQQEQLKEFQIRQMQERMEENADGERNKRIAMQAMQDAADEEQIRKAKMLENNKEYLRANVEQRKIKAERARLEQLELAKIEEFATEKERLVKLRREAEAARYTVKSGRYEAMMKKHHEELQGLRASEQDRARRETKELEDRNLANDAAEAARKQKLKEAIEKSRQKQIARKKRDGEREKLIDQVMIDEWQRQDEIMKRQEEDEEKAEKMAAMEYQNYLVEQRTEKHSKVNLERTKELAAARHHKQRREDDEKVFMGYANTKIREYANKGRSIVPMKLDLMKHERAKRRVTAM